MILGVQHGESDDGGGGEVVMMIVGNDMMAMIDG